MKNFQCDACGSCCKHIDAILEQALKSLPEVARLAAEFPYKSIEGRCEMLTNEDRCSVYSQRPVLCNVRRLYTVAIKGKVNKSREQFYRDNKSMCEVFKSV
jgi:Fe-S-cluster containining protein